MTDMSWMIGIVLFLLFGGFGGYLLLMIFYPEWVGITGKAAHKTLAEHQEGSQVNDNDLFSRDGEGRKPH